MSQQSAICEVMHLVFRTLMASGTLGTLTVASSLKVAHISDNYTNVSGETSFFTIPYQSSRKKARLITLARWLTRIDYVGLVSFPSTVHSPMWVSARLPAWATTGCMAIFIKITEFFASVTSTLRNAQHCGDVHDWSIARQRAT